MSACRQGRQQISANALKKKEKSTLVPESIDLTWMEGFCKWPRFEVVWRGSVESCIWWPMRRKASMTTFPLTLWIGSITTATARADRASKLCKETREGGGKEVEEKMLSAVLAPGARKAGCFREVAVVYNDCCISTCPLWWGEVIRGQEQGGGVSPCTNLTYY